MNKFTRSQMGKIMAYALSAAMAVTVVPTYMMKPLVAEAADVVTSTLNEENIYVKEITGVTNATIVKAYWSTVNLADISTYANSAAVAAAIKAGSTLTSANTKDISKSVKTIDDGVNTTLVIDKATLDEAEKDITGGALYYIVATADTAVTKAATSTTAKYYSVADASVTAATALTSFKVYSSVNGLAEAPVNSAEAIADAEKLHIKAAELDGVLTKIGDQAVLTYSLYNGATKKTIGTLTKSFDGANSTIGTITDGTADKSTFKVGDKIVIDASTTGLSTTGVVGLFTKTGSLKKADAKYLFGADTEGIDFTNNSTNKISFYIPSTVEEGDYYIGVFA